MNQKNLFIPEDYRYKNIFKNKVSREESLNKCIDDINNTTFLNEEEYKQLYEKFKKSVEDTLDLTEEDKQILDNPIIKLKTKSFSSYDLSFDDILNYFYDNKTNVPSTEFLVKCNSFLLDLNLIKEFIKTDEEERNSVHNIYDLRDNTDVYTHMANILYELLEYRSFNDLKNKLLELIDNLMDFLDNIQAENINNIFFFIDSHINKSNTWIFLVFMKLFIDEKNNDYMKFKELFDTKSMFVSNLENCKISDNDLILHFDDMSYSGVQCSKSMESNLAGYLDRGFTCYYYTGHSILPDNVLIIFSLLHLFKL